MYIAPVGYQAGDSLIEIVPPFTIEFDIQRNLLGSSNVASFRIYNLSQVRRSQIRKDPQTYSDIRPIIFQAGYGEQLSDVFVGNISTAVSVREGVDYVTSISCYGGDLAYLLGITSSQFPSGTPIDTIIRTIAGQVAKQSGFSVGAVGAYPGTISRGNSYVGSGMDVLKDLTGNGVFVDNNKINCLNDDECLKGQLEEINSSFGILSTPVRGESNVSFEMLFEPRLQVGQKVIMNLSNFIETNSNQVSQVTKQLNGPYKIVGLKHRGMISDAVCGNATSTVELWEGDKVLQEVVSSGGN